jgi:hypothetical protein
MFNTNSLVNVDSSNGEGNFFTNNKIPTGPHTLPPTGSNIQSAAGMYPSCKQTGGKINRKKINKISIKYKMKGSKKTIRRNIKRIKSRVRSKYARRSSRRSTRRAMKGGAINYPNGYTQYQNNNGSLSNTYSLGGPLTARNSALANPPVYNKVEGQPDNLNHYAKNAYGNLGSGSGFASRGWF